MSSFFILTNVLIKPKTNGSSQFDDGECYYLIAAKIYITLSKCITETVKSKKQRNKSEIEELSGEGQRTTTTTTRNNIKKLEF
jgi:hypothetical protein